MEMQDKLNIPYHMKTDKKCSFTDDIVNKGEVEEIREEIMSY